MQRRSEQTRKVLFDKAVIIDTSSLFALFDNSDQYHQKAANCLHQLANLHLPLWVSNFTIAESHRRILQSFGPRRAFQFLQLFDNGDVTVERALVIDEEQAKTYLSKYDDQDISLNDAISFAIMKRLGIGKAFSFDIHFRLVGFITVPPLY